MKNARIKAVINVSEVLSSTYYYIKRFREYVPSYERFLLEHVLPKLDSIPDNT